MSVIFNDGPEGPLSSGGPAAPFHLPPSAPPWAALEQRVAALEKALAKQRAVTKELWDWFVCDCDEPISEALATAFEEAMK